MGLLPTLLLCAVAASPSCRSTPVAEQGASALRALECSNGAAAVVEQRPGSGTVFIRIGVRAGSRDEPLDQAGISHLLEHLLFREGHGGTRRNPAFSELREAGAVVNASTDFELTEYHADVPADRVEEGWAALFSLVTGTGFDEQDLQQERRIVLQEAASGKTDPMAVAAYSVLRRVFPDDPLGQPVIGVRRTLKGITRGDVEAYHRRHYVPSSIVAVVVGDVEAPHAEAMIERTLGRLPSGLSSLEERASPSPRRRDRFLFRTLVSQAYLLLGALTPGETSPDAPALELLASVLGEGRASRLHRRLVEQEALTEQILALSFQMSDIGGFGAGAAVLPGRAAQARAALREELQRLAREPVSTAELERARGLTRGRLALQTETNEGRAAYRTRRLLLGLPPSLDPHREALDRATPADLLAVARRCWGGEHGAPGPVAIEVLPARGFGKVLAALRYLMFRRL
ncbi:MAG TPA: pitrilysin family protein [Candidatus Polarisedimenticolia bacterium]|nr:pitrilysin family protein [Candidatus Polarisedimenticolia bacterium]